MSDQKKETKIEKSAAVMEELKSMILKEANKPEVDGKPGADTNYTRVSDETEKTDKNNVGPDKLNKEQGYKQEPAKDKSEPVATAKSGEEKEEKGEANVNEIKKESAPSAPIDKNTVKPEAAAPIAGKCGEEKTAKDLGEEVLQAVTKLAEQLKVANKPEVDGKPGADTNYTRVSDETEKTDKNNVGPDKLNKEQGYKQEPAKDKSEPVATAKTSGELDPETEKVAAFEWGRQLAVEYLKTALENEPELYKAAGKRDFETLIAQAAVELEKSAAEEKQGAELFDQLLVQEKQAEEAGAAKFDELYKRALWEVEMEKAAQEKASLEQKIAEYEQKLAAKEAAEKQAMEKSAAVQAELEAKRAEEKRAQEMSTMIEYISKNVFDRIKSETVRA